MPTRKPALLTRPFLNGATHFRIVGPRDVNGNRRDLSIDARALEGEPVRVSAEEFRRIACLAGLRPSLDAEDAEALGEEE